MHTATITVNYYFTSQLLKPSCEAHVLLRESVWFLIRVWWVMDDFSTDEVYYFHMTLYLPVVSVWVVKLFWYRYISVFMRMNTCGEWNPANASEVPRRIWNKSSCIAVKSLHFLFLILFSLYFFHWILSCITLTFWSYFLFVMLFVDIKICGVCTQVFVPAELNVSLASSNSCFISSHANLR